MNHLPCELICDVLPLMADDAVSEETAALVREHLDECEDCRKEYELMKKELRLPANADLRDESANALKNMKKELFWKRTAVSAVSVLLTVVLLVSGYMVYKNVGVVHDFFSPVLQTTVRNSTGGEWRSVEIQRVYCDPAGLDAQETLNFDSLFFKREVINHALSDDMVTLRVLDETGQVVLDDVEVQPGSSASLKELKRSTEYRVEIKTFADHVILRFI